MTKVDFIETIVLPVRTIKETAGLDTALNMTIVYQDPPTRESAFQVWDRVTKIVGEESVHSSWWEIGDLTHSLLLPRAVQDAIEADVIAISVYAEKELPLDLHVWIDAWLPRRLWRTGVLVAVTGVKSSSKICSPQAREYLAAVARRGHLDFQIVEWRQPQTVSPANRRRCSRERTSSGPGMMSTFSNQKHPGLPGGRRP